MLNPEEILIQKEAQEQVNIAISKLQPREQDMLFARLVDELTYREIGERHNITGNRVREIVNRSWRRTEHRLSNKLISALNGS